MIAAFATYSMAYFIYLFIYLPNLSRVNITFFHCFLNSTIELIVVLFFHSHKVACFAVEASLMTSISQTWRTSITLSIRNWNQTFRCTFRSPALPTETGRDHSSPYLLAFNYVLVHKDWSNWEESKFFCLR